jgi:hypothetical protein
MHHWNNWFARWALEKALAELAHILAFTPLYYAVWWKKKIYLGIFVHCDGNQDGGVLMLVLALNI